MARLAAVLAFVLAGPGLAPAQTDPQDGVTLLLSQFDALVETGNQAGLPALLSADFPSADVEALAADLFAPDTRRAVVTERDRIQLQTGLSQLVHALVRRWLG